MRKIYVLLVLLILMMLSLLSCETVKAKTNNKDNYKESDNIEIWILNAQEATNRKKYNEAISILSEVLIKFPEQEVLAVNYNIGYNYYKLKNYNDATSYLNRVISLFENNEFNTFAIQENRKFVILAGLVLDRIENDKKYRRDPYHVTDDLEDIKKNRPKRPKTEE